MYYAQTEPYRQRSRWFVSVAKRLLLFAALVSAPSLARAQGPDFVPGEVLVGFRAQASDRQALATLDAVGESAGQEPALRAHRVMLRPGVAMQDALAFLRRQPGVAYAEPNYIVHATATPNDSSFSSQWALKKIQADQAWGSWQPKQPVIVAIVDTGIDGTHPDLRNKMARDAGNNILGYNAITSTPGAAMDDNGHGTHCAGIIGAQIDNSLGVAGIAGWNGVASASDTTFTRLMPIKAMDKTASGTSSAVSSGIRWAVDHGARVLSLSFGSPNYSITIDGAVQYAASKGCVVVAAAGNNASSAKFYPAACANVISVAASDSSDTLASFSNYGSWVKVAAPGVNILSTTPTYATSWPLNYAYGAGTSMATPHVAGEAALLWAQSPSLSANQVSSLIVDNVDVYYPYAGHTIAAGAGRINVLRALEAASSLSGDPPSAPTNLTATAKSASISLQWSAGAGATSYNVKRATTSGGPYTTIASGLTTTSYVNSGLTNGTTYYYVVTAFNSKGSADSQEVSAKTHSALTSVTINPTSVKGGASATGTVTLDSAAPSGGASITLSDNSSAASVAGSVTVAAGATSANFTVSTSSVSTNTTATITATYSGASKSAALTVQSPAPTLQSLSLGASSVQGGSSVTGTVTLSSAAPSGGASIALSDNSSAVAVAGSVTVAAGATSANFTVSTSSVTINTTATITASYGSVSKSDSLTVTPALTSVPPPTSPTTLAPSADAYVRAGVYANLNFGADTALITRKMSNNSRDNYSRAFYLKFDLTGVTQAPAGATLRLTIDASSNPVYSTKTVNVNYIADSSWTESGITWNNAPGLNRTNFSSTGTLVASKSIMVQPANVTFDLTAFVRAHLGQVVTLQLMDASTSAIYLAFESRQATHGQPQLALTY